MLRQACRSMQSAPRASQMHKSLVNITSSKSVMRTVAKAASPRLFRTLAAGVAHPLLAATPLRTHLRGASFGAQRAMSSLPSHVELTMPALSPTMTAGNIAKWMVSPGDKISPGDHLCDIETDKATIGWEAQEDGYVAKLLVSDGATDIAVGATVMVICDDEKDVAAFADFAPATPAAAPAATTTTPAPTPAAPPPPPPPPSQPSSSVSVGAGGSVVDVLKGKKWVFAKQFGQPVPHCHYF